MALVFSLVGWVGWVVSLIAIHRIITKAGYSGWWVVLPIAPIVSLLLGFAAIVTAIRTGNVSHIFDLMTGWVVFTWLILFVDWIFFLVFAFSDWPALSEPRGQVRPPILPRRPVTVAAPAGPAGPIVVNRHPAFPPRPSAPTPPPQTPPRQTSTPPAPPPGMPAPRPTPPPALHVVRPHAPPSGSVCGICGYTNDSTSGTCGRCGMPLGRAE